MGFLRWALLAAFVITVLVVMSVGTLYWGYSNGWLVKKRPIEELSAFLKPHLLIERPQTGGGPFPVVLIFPGCGGFSKTFHGDWAKFFASQGYIGVAVDSFTPRGLDRPRAKAKVCTGRILWGRERAGDVLAAITQAGAIEGADPSRIILFGQSHGSWSIMDLLAMDFERRGPTNLHPRPDPAPLARVQATLLLYPYCGTLSLTGSHEWTRKVPAFMALAEKDSVISTRTCRNMAEKLTESGVPVSVEIFPDVDHAFDQFPVPEENMDWPGYDEAAAARLRESLAAYLRGLE